jgi:hypothetical protein
MGRLSSPLYKDPDSAIYYFRWYDGAKRKMLSLNTGDLLEAMKRMPIRLLSGINAVIINNVVFLFNFF